MKPKTVQIQDENTSEIDDVSDKTSFIASLAFLMTEAKKKGWFDTVNLLKTARDSVEEGQNYSKRLGYDYTAFLEGYKFFIRFLLLDDPKARVRLVETIEAIEKEKLLIFLTGV